MTRTNLVSQALTRQSITPGNVPTDEHATNILASYPPVLSLKQIAEILQIGETTARQFCRQGVISCAFQVGSLWRCPRVGLEDYILGGNHE